MSRGLPGFLEADHYSKMHPLFATVHRFFVYLCFFATLNPAKSCVAVCVFHCIGPRWCGCISGFVKKRPSRGWEKNGSPLGAIVFSCWTYLLSLLFKRNKWRIFKIRLMEESLHQLKWRIYHYLQGFVHVKWCRISSINNMVMFVYFPIVEASKTAMKVSD